MDFSQSAIAKQAFDVLRNIRPLIQSLPVTLTADISSAGESLGARVAVTISEHPWMKERFRAIIAHNEATETPLGLYVLLFPSQCQGEVLEETVLQRQTMYCPLEGFGSTRAPVLNDFMKDVRHVLVRVEIHLTQEGDTTTWDFRALDPGAFVQAEEDRDSYQRRLAKELHIPKDLVRQLHDIVDEHPEAFAEWAKGRGNQRDSDNMIIDMMRSCRVCAKYGLTLSKCSVCKSVYYCSRDCQTNDWPIHKKVCK